MKLCKDCKYFPPFGSPAHTPMNMPMCMHPNAPIDPVYGKLEISCANMRSRNCIVNPRCGVEGAWFEERDA